MLLKSATTEYRIVTKDESPSADTLGGGAEATVYPVRGSSPKPLALKLYHKPIAGDCLAVEKLRHLAQLGDARPDLPLVLPVDVLDGGRGYVMPLVPHPAVSLRQAVDSQQLTTEERLRVAIALCGAVAAVERLAMPAVVLEDLKPDNVLVLEDLSVRMVDADSVGVYDVRSLVDPSDVHDYLPGSLGTAGYRSPERLRQGGSHQPSVSDARYALAVCVFEVLTNFHPTSMGGTCEKSDADECALLGLFPRWLGDPEQSMGGGRVPPYRLEAMDANVERLLRATLLDAPPHQRASPGELSRALEERLRALQPPPPAPAVPTPPSVLPPPADRRSVWPKLLTLAASAAIVVGGWWWLFTPPVAVRNALPPDPPVLRVFPPEVLSP